MAEFGGLDPLDRSQHAVDRESARLQLEVTFSATVITMLILFGRRMDAPGKGRTGTAMHSH